MPTDQTLLRDAAEHLSGHLGERVELVDVVELDSPGTVLRASLSPVPDGAPSSVIVKRATDTTFDQPDHDGPPQRFLTEWAGLAFLTSLGVGERVSPGLVCGHLDKGMVIIEDLGAMVSLESCLMGPPRPSLSEVITDIGRVLGEIQAAAHGREAEFLDIQGSLGTASPRSDSTADQRNRKNLFEQSMGSLGVPAVRGFWDDVVEVERLIHDHHAYRSLIHADAGPQNFLVSEDGLRLIDFEFCVFRNGLCDVVGARLGFPQSKAAMKVPVNEARSIERAYRDQIVAVIPEASDDDRFHEALTAAAAHWALNRWAAGWIRLVGPAIEDDGDLSGEGRDELGRAMLVLEGMVALADETGFVQGIAAAVDVYANAVRRRWPDIDSPPPYPALGMGEECQELDDP